MAERRYNTDDQKKMVEDRLADLRAKGVDAHDIHSLHPGGISETFKEIDKNFSAVKDQNQQQREEGKQRLQENTDRLKSYE